MPAIREHEPNPCILDDDDGMPPLVDNPNPSMTFTFFTDMTPITALSVDPTIPFENAWENPSPVPVSPIDYAEQPESQATFQGPDRAIHSKKRDASYIPRPPNAFILFRSSFIKSQQVPEKVEGNHSTLSKIIGKLSDPSSHHISTITQRQLNLSGKYWKTLPREEREVWEAKALVAQAEHRRRYPDWRFRPGANALAKLKVKDGPQASNRRRNQAGRKAKGDSAGKKAKSGDERCAMIADLLVEGKTGVDLEDAVKRWEDSTGRGVDRKRDAWKDGSKMGNVDGDEDRVAVANELQAHAKVISTDAGDVAGADSIGTIRANSEEGPGQTLPQLRAQTPDGTPDDRFRIPLTAMFKRSLSAPAARDSPNQASSHGRDQSLDHSVFANVTYDIVDSPYSACTPTFNGEQPEDLAHAVLGESFGNLSPLMLPSVLREGVPARWNDPYNLLETSIGHPPSPACSGLTYFPHTPSDSPIDHTFGSYNFDGTLPCGYTRDAANLYCPPKSWADCVAPHQQMPIFINHFGGAPGEPDWGAPHYSTYVDCADTLYQYSDETGQFDGFGNELIRVHPSECQPTLAY